MPNEPKCWLTQGLNLTYANVCSNSFWSSVGDNPSPFDPVRDPGIDEPDPVSLCNGTSPRPVIPESSRKPRGCSERSGAGGIFLLFSARFLAAEERYRSC